MQRHNAEDEPKTQHKHDHRVNLQTGRFVGVEAWLRGGEGLASGMKRGAFCHYVFVRSWKLGSPFPLLSSPRRILLIIHSTFPPEISQPLTQNLPTTSTPSRDHKKLKYIRNIVLLLPPAPAALVDVGRAFATLSARSAAAFRRMTVFAPPGGLEGRAVVPAEGEMGGEDGGGELWEGG